MHAALQRLAERRIQEAIEAGELDDLPGRGKPLALDDDGAVPEELRTAYRVLKNAGLVPDAIALRAEVNALQTALGTMDDDRERAAACRRLSLLRMRLEASGARAWACGYEGRLLARFAGGGR